MDLVKIYVSDTYKATGRCFSVVAGRILFESTP